MVHNKKMPKRIKEQFQELQPETFPTFLATIRTIGAQSTYYFDTESQTEKLDTFYLKNYLI
jgi:hypothetical protein